MYNANNNILARLKFDEFLKISPYAGIGKSNFLQTSLAG